MSDIKILNDAPNPNSSVTTSDAGYTVNTSHGGDMDTSWKNRQNAPIAANVADVASREFELNEEAKTARRKIIAIMEDSGEMTMADLGGVDSVSDRERQSSLAAFGLEQTVNRVSTDMVQQSHNTIPSESSIFAESYSDTPRNTDGPWKTQKKIATLKNGRDVPVWLIVNENTGSRVEKPFRMQEPALRISTMLNQNGGNGEDVRITRVFEAYDSHVSLMKQFRGLKKMLNEGQKVGNKIKAVRAELEEVNYKLGI